MAAPVFDLVAGELERGTDLARLETRGTVRLALKEAGLDARSVTPAQMAVTLEKVLPGQLRSRGVAHAEGLCQTILETLARDHSTQPDDAESPEAIFRRLAQG